MKVRIALPDTFTEGYTPLRRTVSVSLVARAAAIFGVDRILFYSERNRRSECLSEVVKILKYAETPQYLRKLLFERDESLKFAGVIPPLRTPHHKLKVRMEEVGRGEVREGVVIRSSSKGSVVYVGRDVPALIPKRKLKLGSRVTVRILEKVKGGFLGELVSKEELEEYWGYDIVVSGLDLSELLRREGRKNTLIILTSRLGNPIDKKFEELRKTISERRGVLLVFGSQKRGVFDILGERLRRTPHDFVLNLVPDQKVETIRTEEAVIIALSIVNLALRMGDR